MTRKTCLRHLLNIDCRDWIMPCHIPYFLHLAKAKLEPELLNDMRITAAPPFFAAYVLSRPTVNYASPETPARAASALRMGPRTSINPSFGPPIHIQPRRTPVSVGRGTPPASLHPTPTPHDNPPIASSYICCPPCLSVVEISGNYQLEKLYCERAGRAGTGRRFPRPCAAGRRGTEAERTGLMTGPQWGLHGGDGAGWHG